MSVYVRCVSVCTGGGCTCVRVNVCARVLMFVSKCAHKHARKRTCHCYVPLLKSTAGLVPVSSHSFPHWPWRPLTSGVSLP